MPIEDITVPNGKILQVGDILISSYADTTGAFARVTSLNSANAGVEFVGAFQTYKQAKQGILYISGQSENATMQVTVTVYDGMTVDDVVQYLNDYNNSDYSAYPAQGASYDYQETYVGIGQINTNTQTYKVLKTNEILGSPLTRELSYEQISLYILGE